MWRVVNGLVDFFVERFLANTILFFVSTAVNVFNASHIETVDIRVKGHGDRVTGTHGYRPHFTRVQLQLIDVLLVVVRDDKILIVLPERS